MLLHGHSLDKNAGLIVAACVQKFIRNTKRFTIWYGIVSKFLTRIGEGTIVLRLDSDKQSDCYQFRFVCAW